MTTTNGNGPFRAAIPARRESGTQRTASIRRKAKGNGFEREIRSMLPGTPRRSSTTWRPCSATRYDHRSRARSLRNGGVKYPVAGTPRNCVPGTPREGTERSGLSPPEHQVPPCNAGPRPQLRCALRPARSPCPSASPFCAASSTHGPITMPRQLRSHVNRKRFGLSKHTRTVTLSLGSSWPSSSRAVASTYGRPSGVRPCALATVMESLLILFTTSWSGAPIAELDTLAIVTSILN